MIMIMNIFKYLIKKSKKTVISIAFFILFPIAFVINSFAQTYFNSNVGIRGFELSSEQQQQITVKGNIIASSLEINYFQIVYTGLIIIGFAFAAILIFMWMKSKKEGEIKIKLRLIYRAFLLVYILTVFVGTGLLGLSGNYFSSGSTDNQKRIIVPFAKASARPAPDGNIGYTETMGMRETLANFEFGLDMPYDQVYSRAPHFWEILKQRYSYTPIELNSDKYTTIGATNQENMDNSNYWYVLPDVSGKNDGTCDVIYKLNSPRQTNYQNFAPYRQLRIIWKGENPDNENVNISLSIYNPMSKKWFDIGVFNGESSKKYELTFDLRCISQTDRSYISKIKFTTRTTNLGTKKDGSSYQKNDLFYIDVWSDETVKKDIQIADLSFSTEYLGNVQLAKYGPYSASGFYDPDDKKWKLWYGCAFPESIATDNVYYIETTDPQKGWSLPYRIIPDDPNGVLTQYNKAPGYGGDPAVIKLKGIYYMYITGITSGLPTGVGSSIYLLTSTDGKNFKLVDKPCVPIDLKTHKGAYGQGSPSVIYKDGTFYMYYYSTFDLQGGGMLRTSKDGYNWSEPTRINATAFDVKYIDEIKKWVGCYYGEENQFANPQSPAVRITVSDDGVEWTRGDTDKQMPAQDFSAVINHNPGFIGTPEGHGFKTMFMTYGDNDLPLNRGSTYDMGLAGDTRQLFWSRITIK
jgi:hypothetical protein